MAWLPGAYHILSGTMVLGEFVFYFEKWSYIHQGESSNN